MHKILEFQSVVLAAGRGSRLPDVGGDVSKCLLPVGPYPVLWYSLNMLEKIGFQGKYVNVSYRYHVYTHYHFYFIYRMDIVTAIA